jgi:hypothetical protein
VLYNLEQILKCVSELLESNVVVKYISFSGHSMGGLVARYAIGELYAKKFFDDIKPVNLATFATPHLGTTAPLVQSKFRRFAFNAYNRIGPVMAGGRSGMKNSVCSLAEVIAFPKKRRPTISR